MARKLKLFIILFIPLYLLTFGCAQKNTTLLQDEPEATNSKKIYRGKVLSKSNRNGTISIEIINDDRTGPMEFAFNDKTRGIDHAIRGKLVIVTGKISGERTVITSIKPELTGFMPGVSEIKVKQVKKIITDNDEFVLIDSRSTRQYSLSHLPSAISIPSCAMKDSIKLLPEKKDRLLIFYCGGATCGQSTIASAAAAQAGYTNIKVMLAGLSGWAKAGYSTYVSDDLVSNKDIVLIDLRPARKNTVQRIAGSVSIPSDTLVERMNEISKKAPIVLYSDIVAESDAALARFRTAGFATVSMIEGNFQGWKRRNRPVTSGTVGTEITWKRKIAKGEVSPDTFERAVNNRGTALVLDVRTSVETAAGSLGGAKLIPLNELHERSNELSVDKKIYIYSATGARAKMAAGLLKEKGFKAYFLIADINCQGGNCNIEF